VRNEKLYYSLAQFAKFLHGPGIDEPIAMARDMNGNGTFEEKEVFYYSII
jgi:hypothetical protein